MFGLAVLARVRSILDSGGRMQSELTARRFCCRFGGSSRISHWTRSGGFRFVSRAVLAGEARALRPPKAGPAC